MCWPRWVDPAITISIAGRAGPETHLIVPEHSCNLNGCGYHFVSLERLSSSERVTPEARLSVKHRLVVILLCLSLVVSATGWSADLASGHISPAEHANAGLNEYADDTQYPKPEANHDQNCHTVVHGIALPSSSLTLAHDGSKQSPCIFVDPLYSRSLAPPVRPPRA
jgi:hypothetical protein